MKQKTFRFFKEWIPAFGAAYLADKLNWLYRHCVPGSTSRFWVWLSNLDQAFQSAYPSGEPPDVWMAVLAAVGILLILRMPRKKRKKYRYGEEYGSARWGTAKDIAPFMDPDPDQNIILTATESLMLNSRPKDRTVARNKNVIIIGATGTGKSFNYARPNIARLANSMVVTDPKSELIVSCGTLLERHEYRVRFLNLADLKQSMKYNPFAYVHNETDILKLVNVLIENTKAEGERSSDGFWEKAERLLLSALVALIMQEAPKEEQNFSSLLELLNACEVHEDDAEYRDPVDQLFDELEEEHPEHFAVRQYKRYKQAAAKTAQSILISCGARLAPFDIPALQELMNEDEMYLDTLGDTKTALFILLSDTDTTFNFVAAMLYSQMFHVLCDKADRSPGGRLKVHVQCILDEFANIGKIPNFDKLIATIRSREISASVILQSVSQLKTLYKDASDTILGNCDSHLFLGSKDATTLKQMSEALGKETIDITNTSRNRGNSESFGESYQKTGKPLMTQDELAVMPGNKCILQLRGVRPFYSDKYDFTTHPRYKEMESMKPFDLNAHLHQPLEHARHRRRMNEPFILYDITVGEEE